MLYAINYKSLEYENPTYLPLHNDTSMHSDLSSLYWHIYADMATPIQVTLKKEKKEESFLDKIGTIGRKKKIKEGAIIVFFSICFFFLI